MPKAHKIKGDLDDLTELLEIVQILKDVADTKFQTLANKKDRFERFGQSFVGFFRMISLGEVKHPLVSNDNPTTGIVAITSEASFMGELNSKVIRAVLHEYEQHPDAVLIPVGWKGAERLSHLGKPMKIFENIRETGLYKIAIQIKDYLIEEIMAGRIGRVITIYPWSKNFMIQTPRVVKLFPCDELLTKQKQFVDTIERVIMESDPTEIIGHLAQMWGVCRLYEMLQDTTISEAATQSQHLEGSVERMKKDKRGIQLAFVKARRSEIEKSIREVFSARILLPEAPDTNPTPGV